MTVRWGICTNVNNCADAKHKQHIPIPKGAAFVCPVCSESLIDENAIASQEAPATPIKKSSNTLLIAIAAVLLLAAVAGLARWGTQHSAKAATSTTILRLAGSNTIGDTLGPSLAAAFLKDQGATDVRTLPGANPLEKIVEGVLPGNSKPSGLSNDARICSMRLELSTFEFIDVTFPANVFSG